VPASNFIAYADQEGTLGGIGRIKQFNHTSDPLGPIGLGEEALEIRTQFCVEERRGAVGAEQWVSVGH
jgi:hypothetical protein